MECEEVRNRFADCLRGGLPDPASADLREHLASCNACRDEVGGLETLWTALGDIPAEPLHTDAMRGRFEDMLQGYVQGLDAVRSTGLRAAVSSRLASWWPQQPLVLAGVATVMLAIGVWAGGRAQPSQPPPDPDLMELRRELHDMREMLTLSLMQQQSATERLRGVSGSSQIEQPGAEIVRALLDTLMHDPNINVRLAAVDALRRFAGQDVVRDAAVRALGESSLPLLQIALIDFMVETRDTQAVDALRRLSEDATANEAVRGRAAWGLEQLNS